jgi:hypothetical protein
MSGGEVRDGVSLTNLDQPLFEGAEERPQAHPAVGTNSAAVGGGLTP